MNITEIKRDWYQIMREIEMTGLCVTVTRYGKPVADLIPAWWKTRET